MSALLAGKMFFNLYCPAEASVLEVGAMDVNGSLRSVAPNNTRYTGADMATGPGVDIVLTDPHVLPFQDGAFDVVVSTSCFEHDQFFWLTFVECLRVLKPDGYLYLNVPSNGLYHAYPSDNWRFYPDAGLALAKWGRHQGQPVAVVESFILNQMQDLWNDFVCVFRKCTPEAQQDRGPSQYLHQHFEGATNIWRNGTTQLLRPQPRPEDMRKQFVPRKSQEPRPVRSVAGGAI